MSATLIHGGTVIDGTGRPPVRASVLVEAGRIAAVGAEADARASGSDGLARLDASGLTVMPGLIDSHCHLSFDDAESNPELFHQRRNALSALVAAYNARKLLRAGVTAILDPDSVHENAVDLRDAIDSGVVAGPRIACGCYALIPMMGGTAGRLIADQGVTGYYKVVNGPQEIVAEVRRQIKVGADWIKVHVSGVVPRYAHRGELCNWSQAELDLIVSAAHDLGVPVAGHCRGADSVLRSARAGMDLLFHATAMDDAALEAVIARRIPVCPSLTFQANVADFGAALGTDPAMVSLFEREIADSVPSMKALIAAGVPLLCGSESGFSIVPYGEWHYREMEVFVRHFGMTPLQAIRAATLDNAFAMKRPDELGAIEPGRVADVICVRGDPSRDVRCLGEPDAVRHVMIGGVPQDLTPPPPRRPLAGWRVPMIGGRLTRAHVDARDRGSDDAGAR